MVKIGPSPVRRQSQAINIRKSVVARHWKRGHRTLQYHNSESSPKTSYTVEILRGEREPLMVPDTA
jgi:hypothetical protein